MATNKLSTPSWDKRNKIEKYLQNDQKLREKFKWQAVNQILDHKA